MSMRNCSDYIRPPWKKIVMPEKRVGHGANSKEILYAIVCAILFFLSLWGGAYGASRINSPELMWMFLPLIVTTVIFCLFSFMGCGLFLGLVIKANLKTEKRETI